MTNKTHGTARGRAHPRERVLAFLRDYIAARGFPPTVREIAAAAGLSSTSVASYHLAALEAEGRIQRIPGRSRAIRIVEVSHAP